MVLTFDEMKAWGYISNRLTGALLDGEGRVLWLCFPRYDSDPTIAYVLDQSKGGEFFIVPIKDYSITRYLIAPNVIRTSFKTKDGVCNITNFLIPGKSIFVRDVDSMVPFEVKFKPLFNFSDSSFKYTDAGEFKIFDNAAGKGRLILRLPVDAKADGPGSWLLNPGRAQIALGYYPTAEASELTNERNSMLSASNSLDSTIDFWNEVTSGLKSGIESDSNRFLDVFKSSLISILSLVYSPTGSIIAAPTASLPEDPGGGRNWDYRYVWVRDASMMATALCDAGFIVDGRRALEFLFNIIDYSGKPFYSVYRADGTRIYGEKYIDGLSGFMGSKPVRIGNRATNQMQLDIEGEFLDAVYHYFLYTGDREFVKNHSKAIEYIADWLSDNWQLADSGLWEKPEDKAYVHSKVMVWAALDRAGKLISSIGGVDKWQGIKREVKEWVLSNGTRDGHFVVSPDSEEVDASFLVFPLVGFVDVKDPIFLNTLKLIEEKLFIGGFVYRYLLDSLGRTTKAFSLCSAWLASIYYMLGRKDDADKILFNLMDLMGEDHLIGEDIDVEKKTFTGNFPQGFAHAALVECLLNSQHIRIQQKAH